MCLITRMLITGCHHIKSSTATSCEAITAAGLGKEGYRYCDYNAESLIMINERCKICKKDPHHPRDLEMRRFIETSRMGEKERLEAQKQQLEAQKNKVAMAWKDYKAHRQSVEDDRKVLTAEKEKFEADKEKFEADKKILEAQKQELKAKHEAEEDWVDLTLLKD